MDTLQIGTCESKPGELTAGKLKIRGTDAFLDVYVAQGLTPGPTAFVVGGMHGDEINGPQLVRMVMEAVVPKVLKGNIIFIPVLNAAGFIESTRESPIDGNDLNRSFKPDEGESFSFKLAKTVLDEVVRVSDYGIDCHDAGGTTALMPHPRVHVDDHGTCSDGCTLDLGKIFGSEVVLEREGAPGMMAIEIFTEHNKPVVTVELGGGLILWPKLLEEGLQGVMNLLIDRGNLEGEIVLPEKQVVIDDTCREMHTALVDGLLHKKVQLGDKVHTGQQIAVISEPSSGIKTSVAASGCGYVFSIRVSDVVNAGDQVASILQIDNCAMHSTMPHTGMQAIA